MGRPKKHIDLPNVELELNPIFEPIFEDHLDQPRYYQVYGGRGSGKSFAVSLAMVELTYSELKHKILYLRQTMTSSEDSTIADIREAIKIKGAQAHFREYKGTIINVTTGASIIFKGIRSSGSQTAKLKSLSGITTLVVEEAEEVESFAEFSKIDESIRIKGKPLKIILIYNPTSSVRSWIHSEWFVCGQPRADRYHDTVYIHSTYLDNIDNLNESVVRRYQDLEKSNPTYYKQTILAEWTLEVTDQIYAGWETYDFFDNDGDIWYGLDFGYGGNDKTSCIKINYFEGVYYITELFSIAKLSLKETRTKLRKSFVPFNALIYADSAMPLLINNVREGGWKRVRKANKGNVEAGIKLAQNKHVVIVGRDKTIPVGKREDLFYHYQTFARNDKGKLPHEPDILAAFRYGVNSKKPINSAKKAGQQRRKLRINAGYLKN